MELPLNSVNLKRLENYFFEVKKTANSDENNKLQYLAKQCSKSHIYSSGSTNDDLSQTSA